MGAVSSAKEFILMLDAVADDAASTMETGRGERLNRAFKRIERVGATSLDNVKGFVVSVLANDAGSHSVRSSFVAEAWIFRFGGEG
jgi:hypothetical protein